MLGVCPCSSSMLLYAHRDHEEYYCIRDAESSGRPPRLSHSSWTLCAPVPVLCNYEGQVFAMTDRAAVPVGLQNDEGQVDARTGRAAVPLLYRTMKGRSMLGLIVSLSRCFAERWRAGLCCDWLCPCPVAVQSTDCAPVSMLYRRMKDRSMRGLTVPLSRCFTKRWMAGGCKDWLCPWSLAVQSNDEGRVGGHEEVGTRAQHAGLWRSGAVSGRLLRQPPGRHAAAEADARAETRGELPRAPHRYRPEDPLQTIPGELDSKKHCPSWNDLFRRFQVS